MSKSKVYVYAADTAILNDDTLFAAGYSAVSDLRRAKTDRFLFKKDKILSIGAELLLRYCLKEHGIPDYTVAYGEYGKPYLKGTPCGIFDYPVHFNLSHSQERVMCAISESPVGCDVEKTADADLEVARRFFTAEEYMHITAQTERQKRNDAFFELWTLKESLMKATGLGAMLPPESFKTDIENGNFGYNYKTYDLSDGYKYAVCSVCNIFDEHIRFADLSNI